MTVLSGLLVVELASVLAGPSVGQFLAELGARVIKIENPRTGGDVTRSWTGDYFHCCNFGKESLTLDLGRPLGKDALRQLVERADIVLSSFAPGADRRLGLGDDVLRAWNPAIIHAAISGYGPESERAGYDALIQAESGFMDMNGQEDGPPTKMPVALVDILAAHHVKEGILLALLRQRSGNGQGAFIQVSLMDAALSSLANQATGWFASGAVQGRHGSTHPNISPYGTLVETSDNVTLMLAIGNNRQFQRLCDLLDVPGLGADPRFASNAARVEHRDALERLLVDAFRTRSSPELLMDLQEAGVPVGPVRTLKDALAEGGKNVILPNSSGTDGLKQWVGLSSADSAGPLCPPPALGQHSRQILHEFTTLSEGSIEDMIRSGARSRSRPGATHPHSSE
ncbi:MAG: crotonobetainyl-CoA:carnitine CoA-transferase CaiB-like acyl-CoA transferase [Rhodothermales bacterium]